MDKQAQYLKFKPSTQIFIALMSFFLSLSAYGEAIQYRTDIQPLRWSSMLGKEFEVKMRVDYDSTTQEFNIYARESLYTAGYTITRDQADAMIKGIDKYNEWNTKALKKAVILKKEITKVILSRTFWKLPSNEWNFGQPAEMTIYFFSQNAKRHQLIFTFPKFQNIKESYSTHSPEILYFDHGEAMKLWDALTKKSIEQFLIKAAKQAQIESEFI